MHRGAAHAREEDGAERVLKVEVARDDDARKVRVEAHAGRERDPAGKSAGLGVETRAAGDLRSLTHGALTNTPMSIVKMAAESVVLKKDPFLEMPVPDLSGLGGRSGVGRCAAR